MFDVEYISVFQKITGFELEINIKETWLFNLLANFKIGKCNTRKKWNNQRLIKKLIYD